MMVPGNEHPHVATDITPTLGAVLQDVQQFCGEFKDRYGHGPEPGSPLAIEVEDRTESGPKGPWTPVDIAMPYELAGGVLILSTEHYLSALCQLLQPTMALFGFQVIARATVESAAQAWWLLEPGIPVRKRVARAYTARWNSVEERRKADESAGLDANDHQRRSLAFRVSAAELGLAERYEKDDKTKRVIGFERIVPRRITSLVHAYLSWLGMSKGEYWYRCMSGVAHSTLFGLLEYLDFEPGPSPLLKAIPSLPAEAVANAVALATDAYLGIVQLHAEHFGRAAADVLAKRKQVMGTVLSAVGAPVGGQG